MPRLVIRHETVYAYEAPVRFGPWRLLMRPLDTHAERIVRASMELSPQGLTRWTLDAYGNCICTFTPRDEADRLSVVNHLIVDRFPAPLAPLGIDDPRSLRPIIYTREDRAVLNPFITPATGDEDDRYLDWLRAEMGPSNEPVLDLIQRMNTAIHKGFVYGSRQEYGTQTPAETVRRAAGTCRDLAWLMIESLRRLGFAARFVTGYLYSPRLAKSPIRGAGATHAWCEVFLPDLGWMEFDPTNGLAESPYLIRVGATRTPEEASPMHGIVYGDAGSALTVKVDVNLVQDAEAPSRPA